MSERVGGVSEENVVQEPRKGRSQAEKIGRNKWNTILLKRCLREIKRLRADFEGEMKGLRDRLRDMEIKQNLILKGFKGYGLLAYTPPMLQRIACKDAVDLAILDIVFKAGAPGVLPRDVALDTTLRRYGLKHYHVSRRIVRMNKRLLEEIGEDLFEKRGLKWALTSFAFDAWGEVERSNDEGIPAEGGDS